jgi:Polyketide cyclase / dehydrase and lipid transport
MKNHFEASAVIDARPEEVYAVLADYREGHPHIVPQEFMRGMEVESGGYGAGTVIRYRTRAFGVERPARAVVSEPEPGRVLVETLTTAPIVTTCTVTPLDDGQRSHVTMATEWQPASTIAGKLEQAMYPFIMRRWYPKELKLLAAFVKSKQLASHS